MRHKFFDVKKGVFFVVSILFLMNIFMPVTNSIKLNSSSNNKDFSIIIHKIFQDDEIDPFPHLEGGDWKLSIYVNDEKRTLECSGKEVILDKILVWEDIIQENMKFLEIRFELLDLDSGVWPDEHDIADISAYADENYYDGKYDDTEDFENNRPAVFKRYYNLVSEKWEEVDNNNDYLQEVQESYLTWFLTSGNFDGSTTTDENDVSIWFDISIGNSAPFPPETPSGPTSGWVDQIYLYTTKTNDPDNDKIKYGWDWDGDDEIDQITDFFDPWESADVYHGWSTGKINYVKVCAIDEKGAVSEWSNELKVEINGPYGKSGFELEEWSLGEIYCVYLDHYETTELLDILRGGGNIVTAAAGLISAIATAAGVPLDISISIAIVTGILRLGVEVINLMDRGMGIYVKTYIVMLEGVPLSYFSVMWSQSLGDDAWSIPDGNQAPNTPNKPIGEIKCKKGKSYTFTSVSDDPNDDKIAYVFEWGDGTYSCVDYNNSGESVSQKHNWSEIGEYNIRVKAIDIYGYESKWSEPLNIEINKKSKIKFFLKLENFYEVFKNVFGKEICREVI